MKKALWIAVVLAAGQSLAGEGKDKTCGQVMGENAKYHRQMASTLTAAAEAYDAHAEWMKATKGETAKQEREALIKVAQEHRALAKSATALADRMARLNELPGAEHDMATIPRRVTASMDKSVAEMDKLAQLFQQGAAEWKAHSKEMKGMGGSGGAGRMDNEGMRMEMDSMPKHAR